MVRDAILELLAGTGIDYRHVEHEATRTSKESATARGEPLEIGGKALLLKVDDRFELFVLSAARHMISSRARKGVGARRSRFATPEELYELTGLVPGTVPPFGEPILPFPLNADRAITENAKIAFNVAVPTESIVMAMEDWLRVARPRLLDFTRP